MPQLVSAAGPLLERIYDVTWPLWSDGLSRAGYEKYNRAQMATPWGRAHLERVAWVEGQTLLASAKRYRLTLLVDGAPVPCLGIGAVFTPEEQRGRGHAPALIEAMCDAARQEGAAYALLFSEIDPGYYGRLGFERIPVTEAVLELAATPRAGAPAILMCDGGERDLANIAAMHGVRAEGYGLAMARSADYVRYAIARRRLLAALGTPGERSVEFLITEEGGNAVAYVVISHGPDGRWLEEWGDRDPTAARVGAMLQAVNARTPSEPPPPLRAWLPAEMRPPQVVRADEQPAAEVGMIRSLDDRAIPRVEPWDVFYFKGDAF